MQSLSPSQLRIHWSHPHISSSQRDRCNYRTTACSRHSRHPCIHCPRHTSNYWGDTAPSEHRQQLPCNGKKNSGRRVSCESGRTHPPRLLNPRSLGHCHCRSLSQRLMQSIDLPLGQVNRRCLGRRPPRRATAPDYWGKTSIVQGDGGNNWGKVSAT